MFFNTAQIHFTHFPYKYHSLRNNDNCDSSSNNCPETNESTKQEKKMHSILLRTWTERKPLLRETNTRKHIHTVRHSTTWTLSHQVSASIEILCTTQRMVLQTTSFIWLLGDVCYNLYKFFFVCVCLLFFLLLFLSVCFRRLISILSFLSVNVNV